MCTLTILIRVSLVATRTNRYVVVARNAISSSLIDDMKIARGARISKFHKWNDTIESGVSSPWYLDSIRERNACDFESKLDTHAMRATDLRRERERERERERSFSLSPTINSVTILIPSIRHDRTRVRRSPHVILMTRHGSNALW